MADQRIQRVEMCDQGRIHPVEDETADGERIHTVEVSEASTSEPLPPSRSSRSGKDEVINEVASQTAATVAPGPASPSEVPTNGRSRYLRWCCWTTLVLLILFLLLLTFFALLLLIFRPKAPKYSFNSLRIASFSISPNESIYAGFDMEVTIRNPNKHVGIYYERGSNVSVWYANASLCTGSVPKFYQGSKNTTVLHVLMTGEAQLGELLMLAMQGMQRARQIPLEVRARVPLKLKFGTLKLWKMRFSVRCDFVVNSLTSGNVSSIQGSRCHGLKKKIL